MQEHSETGLNLWTLPETPRMRLNSTPMAFLMKARLFKHYPAAGTRKYLTRARARGIDRGGKREHSRAFAKPNVHSDKTFGMQGDADER